MLPPPDVQKYARQLTVFMPNSDRVNVAEAAIMAERLRIIDLIKSEISEYEKRGLGIQAMALSAFSVLISKNMER